jgi:aspartate dehydrogenase
MTSLGIIGSGNVASEILKFNLCGINKIYVYDIDKEKLHSFCEEFCDKNIEICSSIKEVIFHSDIIVETASISAVDEIFKHIKKFKQKHFIILSVGGVLKNFSLYKKLISEGYKIHIPSGAIAGCDALSAAALGDIKFVELRTIKPTSSLIASYYFKKYPKLYKKVLKSNKKIVVFEGNVFDAIKYFPQNINVAATLAVLSGKPKNVRVSIIADKKIKKNIHEVKIVSSSGKILTRTENIPSPNNPKTSYLAVLSVVCLLKSLLNYR